MYRLIKNLAIAGALAVSSAASAAINGAYTEDFEACDPLIDTDAIGAVAPFTCGVGSAGFQVGANVFAHPTLGGGFLYNYFPFPAGNNAADSSAQFTGLASGEGGVDQGAQQLNTFNDYSNKDHYEDNLGPNDPGFTGTPCVTDCETIQAVIFKEWTIGAADLDKTWVFRYSYKSDTTPDGAPAGTTNAFISTIQPGTFAQTNLVETPTDDRTGTWVVDIEISLFLDSSVDDVTNPTGLPPGDGVPDLQGQFFQIGFNNTASGLSPSGLWYDNLNVVEGGCVNDGLGDADGDLVDDNCDNCTNVSNADQTDTDGDGHGNICDGDFNQSCTTNISDLFLFKGAFNGSDPLYNLNSVSTVNISDLFIFKGLFNSPPGPSATVCVP